MLKFDSIRLYDFLILVVLAQAEDVFFAVVIQGSGYLQAICNHALEFVELVDKNYVFFVQGQKPFYRA